MLNVRFGVTAWLRLGFRGRERLAKDSTGANVGGDPKKGKGRAENLLLRHRQRIDSETMKWVKRAAFGSVPVLQLASVANIKQRRTHGVGRCA